MPAFLLTLVGSRWFWAALAVSAIVAKGWLWHHEIVVRVVAAEHHRMQVQIYAANERRRQEVAEWVLEATKRRAALQVALEQKREVIRIITKEIHDAIPVYVRTTAPVPVGFVRVHDAAARGEALPDAPGSVVDSPSGIGLPAVADTVAANYAECRIWRDTVIGWQSWYSNELKNWSK